MEKGPSNLVEYWAYEGSDMVHCNEHAEEFGLNKNQVVEYCGLAKSFIRTKEKGNMLFQKPNGSIYKYNPITKQLGIYSKSGKLISFFKTSMKYYLREFNKADGAIWLYKGEE